MKHRLLTYIPALSVVGLVSLAIPAEAKSPQITSQTTTSSQGAKVVTQQAATKEATRQAAVKAKLTTEKDAIAVFARGLC